MNKKISQLTPYPGSAPDTALAEIASAGVSYSTPLSDLRIQGPPGPAGGAPGLGYVYLSQEGVVGDGGTDDTAAINAVFASLAGSRATVVWDKTNCRVTDTIIVGVPTGSSAAPASFINIISPYGTEGPSLLYYGPVDRPALRFAKNKYFQVEGLSVVNRRGRNTVPDFNFVGMLLGGSGGANAGTCTLAGKFYGCTVSGFDIGISDGFSGASSEIIWHGVNIYNCAVGYTQNDFNTLDHIFICPSGSDNDIFLDTGAAEGFHIYGGSVSSSRVADINVGSNGRAIVQSFRSENAVIDSVRGQGGSLIIRGCSFLASQPPLVRSVSGVFNTFDMEDCRISGWIQFSQLCNRIRMVNNSILIEEGSHLPFIVDSPIGSLICKMELINNIGGFPEKRCDDVVGTLQHNADSVYGFSPVNFLYIPTGLRINSPNLQTADSTAALGIQYQTLSCVRQLGEAPPLTNASAVLTGVTNASTAAGNATLHFAATPEFIYAGLLISGTGVAANATVTGFTTTTVTMSAVAVGGGVGSGATITFTGQAGEPIPGQNLRVSGTFAASGTLNFTFKRTIQGWNNSIQTTTLIATSGRFYSTDVGKPILIAGFGNQTWTDWHGFGLRYVDSTHLVVHPADIQQAPFINVSNTPIVIGADEPDANYMVVGIVGDTATPETFSVTAQTATGFTVKSSNAASVANINAMIVR
jgi:hypothetical protein